MTSKLYNILFLLITFTLNSCSTVTTFYLPDTFTTENIMAIHQGMSSDEVLKKFGAPKNVRQAVCGNADSKWNCITWEFGKSPYDSAIFTFDGDSDQLILNNFEVNRQGIDLPKSFITENILKIKQGMNSTEVLRMFGFPVSVSQSVCGSATGNPWICTTWRYGRPPYGNASFTFNGNHDSLVLNDFKVDKD